VPALLSFHAALTTDVLIWALWSTLVGWWATHLPDEAFDRDGRVTRLRVGVRRWKGHLPDLGGLVGGRRKRLPSGRDPDEWRVLAVETRRAECAHWVILLALPVEALIRSGVVLVPMTAYALVANVPCIVAQRSNRGRLEALLAARRRRRTATS
jgi:glycosyl-4,4'-diaponeurosporenoate acyltransferase